MSFGSTAYESYLRIHAEMGKSNIPSWEEIPHLRRVAWEAAAQAVAKAVLESTQFPDLLDLDEDIDEAQVVLPPAA